MFDSLRVSNRLVPANKQNIKRREDDESNKQAAQTEAESSNTSLAQSRGLQYVQDLQDGKTPQRKPLSHWFSMPACDLEGFPLLT